MRIATVVGTRPQLIKLAALQPAIRARHDEIVIDTGQHYDDAMAGTFFRELHLAPPDHALGVGGGSGTEQTGRMLLALEPVLQAASPDAVLVVGDTNSTLAGSLAAAKLGLPVAHVEAGLRSFDRGMPEETNRIVADHLAAWNFAPTPTAVANLAREGLADRTHLVGDVMQDLVARIVEEVRDESAAPLPSRSYAFATIHRAENRRPDAVRGWAAVLNRVATASRPVLLALHPGTRAVLEDLPDVTLSAHVHVVEPLGYRASIAAQLHAALVLTDSGGVQREAAWLGVPCLVLRDRTEWLETVAEADGRTVVVGLDADRAMAAAERLTPSSTQVVEAAGASDRISRILTESRR